MEKNKLFREKINKIFDTDNIVFYDGECPFCSNYVMLSNIREAYKGLKIVNAREYKEELQDFFKYFDIDEGMIFINSSKIYHGAEAFRRINMIANYKDFMFLKALFFVFKFKSFSNFTYPLLKIGRNLTLKILRKRKIF